MFGEGISYEGDILDLATKYELVGKSGSWYSYNDERIGQGREQSMQYLKANPKITAELRQMILDKTINKAKLAAEAAGKATDKATDKKEAPAKEALAAKAAVKKEKH